MRSAESWTNGPDGSRPLRTVISTTSIFGSPTWTGSSEKGPGKSVKQTPVIVPYPNYLTSQLSLPSNHTRTIRPVSFGCQPIGFSCPAAICCHFSRLPTQSPNKIRLAGSMPQEELSSLRKRVESFFCCELSSEEKKSATLFSKAGTDTLYSFFPFSVSLT